MKKHISLPILLCACAMSVWAAGLPVELPPTNPQEFNCASAEKKVTLSAVTHYGANSSDGSGMVFHKVVVYSYDGMPYLVTEKKAGHGFSGDTISSMEWLFDGSQWLLLGPDDVNWEDFAQKHFHTSAKDLLQCFVPQFAS